MQQETADELAGFERHPSYSLRIDRLVILVSELDLADIVTKQTAVADGDFMRVASEIVDGLLGGGRRRCFGVDGTVPAAGRGESIHKIGTASECP